MQQGDTVFQTPAGAARVNINDVQQGGEGGRVSIVFDTTEPAGDDSLFEDMKMHGGTLILNYRKDDPMRAFPATREAMETARYTITLTKEA